MGAIGLIYRAIRSEGLNTGRAQNADIPGVDEIEEYGLVKIKEWLAVQPQLGLFWNAAVGTDYKLQINKV